MGLKKFYKKTKATLTSDQAKRNYAMAKSGLVKAGNYFQTVNRNLDETFAIKKRLPDNTYSNYNKSVSFKPLKKQFPTAPKGYKLVKKKPKVPRGYKLVKKKPRTPKGYRLVRI